MDLFALLVRFQNDYPIARGYRVTSDLKDGLALCSGRLALASSSDQRLPIEGFMISTHQLLDREGQVLRDGRAMRAVSTPEDLVALEQESLTRLLTKLGYEAATAASAPGAQPDQPTPVGEHSAPVQETPMPSGGTLPSPTPIPLSRQRQLDSLAKHLGIEPPHCTSLQEANEALLKLKAQVRSGPAGPGAA